MKKSKTKSSTGNDEKKGVKKPMDPAEEGKQELSNGNSTNNLEDVSGQDEHDVEPGEDDPKDKISELNDKYLRLYSEFDNFKRRTAKERIELYKSAGEDIIISLLPVIDDMERAIVSNDETEDIEIIRQGFHLVYNKLKNALEQKGLKNMDSMKKKFDTDMHEAMTKIKAPSRRLKGKVVDVIEKGYTFNEKVIRYAKVVVGE